MISFSQLAGIGFGLIAYGIWGFFPLFFRHPGQHRPERAVFGGLQGSTHDRVKSQIGHALDGHRDQQRRREPGQPSPQPGWLLGGGHPTPIHDSWA